MCTRSHCLISPPLSPSTIPYSLNRSTWPCHALAFISCKIPGTGEINSNLLSKCFSFSDPKKEIYSSVANPSQDPVLPGPGLSFSLISCQRSPNTPRAHVLSPPAARFHTSMHLITQAACYACSVLLPPLRQENSTQNPHKCHLITRLLEDFTDTSRLIFHNLLVFPLSSVGKTLP